MDKRLIPFGLLALMTAAVIVQGESWPIAVLAGSFAVATYMVVGWWGAGWLLPIAYRGLELAQVYPDLAEAFEHEISGWAQAVGIRAPRLYLVESSVAGAYAVGVGHSGTIMVTTRLLETCSYNEARALLAHEVAHLREGDTVMGAATLVLTTVAMLGAWVLAGVGAVLPLTVIYGVGVVTGAGRYAAIARKGLRRIPAQVQALVSWLMSLLMTWSYRDAELAADRLGAQLAGRDYMMIAVAKLPLNRHAGVDGIARLLDFHGATEDRIEALLALAPLTSEIEEVKS